MPGGDGTGPFGMGPMTGRAAGFCAGYPVPGYMNPIPGRGFWRWGAGRGFWGRGRGWRHWYYATGLPGWARAAYPWWGSTPWSPLATAPSREDELKALKQQAEFFQECLSDIQKRVAELEKSDKEE